MVVYIYRGRARGKVRGRFRGRSKGRFKGKVKEKVRGRVIQNKSKHCLGGGVRLSKIIVGNRIYENKDRFSEFEFTRQSS